MSGCAAAPLLALPAFDDNYIWLLHDGDQALVVDPGDAAPVREALHRLGLRLTGILVTHHHGDHVGGLAALAGLLQGPIWGPARETLPVPVTPCSEGQVLRWGCHTFQVIEVPGHTAGHIAFLQLDAAQPLLFCGDTLFSAGCGRLFEGTPAQMHASLQRLAALPGDARVCCTHEYTLSNLRFARTIEPQNEAAAQHEAWCHARRAQQLPTLPSTLALELRINPFLRCGQPTVRRAALQRDPLLDPEDEAAVFACLRQWKNEFR